MLFLDVVAIKDGNATVEINDDGTEAVCTFDNGKYIRTSLWGGWVGGGDPIEIGIDFYQLWDKRDAGYGDFIQLVTSV